jgi:putative tryptophan/tyrosine transport system substrate-binding protein
MHAESISCTSPNRWCIAASLPSTGNGRSSAISGRIAYPDFFLELTLFFSFVSTAEAKTSGSSRSVKVHTPPPDNFSRPNGNLTGVSILLSALGSKQLELLRELLVPSSGAIALLVNPGNPNFEVDVADIRAAADALGLQLEVLMARTDSDLEAAFATMIRQRVSALVVKPDPLFSARRELLVTLAARHAMPAIYPFRTFVELGGLMSYGGAILDLNRQAGTYVGKILRGAKPADLPVQQSVTFELLINLKTVKALGLTVPPSLLARADEVIE